MPEMKPTWKEDRNELFYPGAKAYTAESLFVLLLANHFHGRRP
jgi:hypothetical protein